jgi:lysine-specific demethylase 3
VEAWTFEQNYGEAVVIPAGCPHQVRNLKVHLGPELLLFCFDLYLMGIVIVDLLIAICLSDAVMYQSGSGFCVP